MRPQRLGASGVAWPSRHSCQAVWCGSRRSQRSCSGLSISCVRSIISMYIGTPNTARSTSAAS